MIDPGEEERRVLPRWRDVRRTAMVGELASNPRDLIPAVSLAEFDAHLTVFQGAPSIETAVEAVSAALVLGQEHRAIQPADLLLRHGSSATLSARALATAVLGGKTFGPTLNSQGAIQRYAGNNRRTLAGIRVRNARKHVAAAPRNALAWTDLSLYYATTAERAKARQAMEIALRLAPGHRHITRSAARLFTHLKQRDRANDILKKTPGLDRDPWLLAAELATAEVAGRTSPNVRAAERLLKSDAFPPFHMAELAATLAALAQRNGNHRRARKLYRQSLIAPNDNALAQVGWAARQDPSLEFDAGGSSLPLQFEANYWDAFIRGDWDRALEQVALWADDEPYSKRAPANGSFIAISLLGDYQLGEVIARDGLACNPGERMLVNNLVVGLAYQGRLDEAERLFASIDPRGDDEVTFIATRGLLAYRAGRCDQGQADYLTAIEQARKQGLQTLADRAVLHLYREELRIDPELGPLLLGPIGEILKRARTAEITKLAENVKLEASGQGAIERGISALTSGERPPLSLS